jgi:hypothetical protein
MSTNNDQLVADYLGRLRSAASRLPTDRRADLVGEIAIHIAEARAEGPADAGSPVYLRNILERLGEPDEIVRAADQPANVFASMTSTAPPASTALRTSTASPVGAAAPASAASASTFPAGLSDRPGRLGPLEISALVLLLFGGFLAGIGWLAGVVLLWMSPRWQTGDKALGTAVWPGGLVAPAAILAVYYARSQFVSSVVFGLALIFVLFGLFGPLLVTVRLVRQARRQAARPQPAPAELQPV